MQTGQAPEIRRDELPIVQTNVSYRTRLFRIAQFELNSLIGRTFLNRRPRVGGRDVMLNLGAGSRPSERNDWINADFFPGVVSRNLFTCLRRNNNPDWSLDLRYPFNCPDSTWSGVFTSHTLEHLHYDHAFQVIREIHRTLRPGSWVRIVLPDLEKYVQSYRGRCAISEFSQYQYGAEAIHNLTQNHRHLSVWDFELLRVTLLAAGFEEVSRVSYRSGSDQRLFLDLEVRDWESFYAEAKKACAQVD